VDFDRNRPHYQINREHDAKLVLLAHQDAFRASQQGRGSPALSVQFSGTDRVPREPVCDSVAQHFHLVIIEFRRMSAETNEAHEARRPQHAQALLGNDVNENISRE
jgi:hypothetical protein